MPVGRSLSLDPNLLAQLQSHSPTLWLNPHQGMPLPDFAPTAADLADADARLRRCAGLLAELFAELRPSGGLITSPLQPAEFHESSPIVPGRLGARNLPLPIGAYL
ncbi:hypothetical protein LV178_19305, partial [Burkholderia mallei]|nr:hypothetical protein [Burkholderia mallei]